MLRGPVCFSVVSPLPHPPGSRGRAHRGAHRTYYQAELPFDLQLNRKHGLIQTKMDETIIFLLLLPAILFSKGYTFKKGAFVKNIRFIALFGIVGTFLLYIVITLLVYAAN